LIAEKMEKVDGILMIGFRQYLMWLMSWMIGQVTGTIG